MAMTLKRLYEAVGGSGAEKKRALSVLEELDWMTCTVEFDRVSGMPNQMPISRFLYRNSYYSDWKRGGEWREKRAKWVEGFPHDRVWRIVDHVRESISRLFRSLNENPAREHEVMHIRSVRELDAASFIKLSNRPGRNVREKLASRPYLQAVKRYMSLDIAENRLLKACAQRLQEILDCRYELMKRLRGDDVKRDPLLEEIARWLRSDEADSISRWENTPPNNTLISHRDYKRVWEAWLWLQALDEDTDRDCAADKPVERTRRADLLRFWFDYALAWKKSREVLVSEVPLSFDYDKYSIVGWNGLSKLPIVVAGNVRQVTIGDISGAAKIHFRPGGNLVKPQSIEKPVCIDLSHLSPVYSTGSSIEELPIRLVWQSWARGGAANRDAAFSLFGADMLWRHSDADTVAIADMLSPPDEDMTREGVLLQSRAARSSAVELRRILKNETLVWLAPDSVNVFDLRVIRGNLNAVFPKASPLWRSVARVFEIDPRSIPARLAKSKDGCVVVVQDATEEGLWATKMTARFSPQLLERVPESQGIYWEHNPSNLLSARRKRPSALLEMDQLGDDASYKAGRESEDITVQCLSDADLKRRPDFGSFWKNVFIEKSPVVGGLRANDWQQRAGDIAVWRENLPALSIEYGLWNDLFYLIDQNTGASVSASAGGKVEIPIKQEFGIPVGRQDYTFRLHQQSGNSQRELNYFVRLHFDEELQSNGSQVAVRFKLTYTYDAEDTYDLVVYPGSQERRQFKPIHAEWIRDDGSEVAKDIPVPKFPARKSMAELQHYPNKRGDGYSNLLEELLTRLDGLTMSENECLIEDYIKHKISAAQKFRDARVSGTIKKMLDDYCFVVVDGMPDVFCRYDDFMIGRHEIDGLDAGDVVYLNVNRKKDEGSGRDRAKGLYVTNQRTFSNADLERHLRRKLDDPDTRRYILSQQRKRDHDLYYNLLGATLSRCMFFVLTIWNGRSLQDAEFPNGFRNKMAKMIKKVAKVVTDEDAPEHISKKALRFLAALHKDAINYTGEDLYNAACGEENFFNLYCNCIPLVVGDVSLPVQREILNGVLERVGHGKTRPLNVLSTVLWRSEKVIEMLPLGKLQAITEDLLDELRTDLEKLKRPPDKQRVEKWFEWGIRGRHDITKEDAIKEERRSQQQQLCRHLELLLALLRTRESADEKIKNFFSPNAKATKRFIKAMKEISDFAEEHDLELGTRFAALKKPKSMERVPDLLYALQLYLTGNSTANMITILETSDDTDED